MIGNQYVALDTFELLNAINPRTGVLYVVGRSRLPAVPFGQSFELFRGKSPEGDVLFWYDPSVNLWRLNVRGVEVLATVAPDTVAGPTTQNWLPGDICDWAIWHAPGEPGTRSMGIRILINNSCGFDTVGVAAGGALAPLTSAVALGYDRSEWRSPTSLAASDRSRDTIVQGVLLGDSLTIPWLVGVRGVGAAMRADHGVANLARSGGTLVTQLTVWQGSVYRGDSTLKWIGIRLGRNDVVADAQTEAQVITRFNNLIADINSKNPGARIFALTPAPNDRRVVTAAQHATLVAISNDIMQTGGTPLAGVIGVDLRLTDLAGANLSSKHKAVLADDTHTNSKGRTIIGESLRTSILANGIAP